MFVSAGEGRRRLGASIKNEFRPKTFITDAFNKLQRDSLMFDLLTNKAIIHARAAACLWRTQSEKILWNKHKVNKDTVSCRQIQLEDTKHKSKIIWLKEENTDHLHVNHMQLLDKTLYTSPVAGLRCVYLDEKFGFLRNVEVIFGRITSAVHITGAADALKELSSC